MLFAANRRSGVFAVKTVVLAAVVGLVSFAAGAQETALQDRAGGTERADRKSEQPLWSEFEKDESTLLPQLNAVIASLRAKDVDDGELVAATVEMRISADPDAESTREECRVMPSPGSRIRTERCFSESPGEKALNEYQFDEEIRFAREQAELLRMEEMNRRAQQEAARRMMPPTALR